MGQYCNHFHLTPQQFFLSTGLLASKWQCDLTRNGTAVVGQQGFLAFPAKAGTTNLSPSLARPKIQGIHDAHIDELLIAVVKGMDGQQVSCPV